MPIPSRSYSRVLVVLDGSLLAEFAVAYAVDLARKHHAELLLLYLNQPGAEPPSAEAQLTGQRPPEDVHAYLSGLHGEIRETGLHVHEHVIEDAQPGKALRSFIDSELASVVVMSTQGRRPMLSWLFGDDIETALIKIMVPVLLVRPTYDQVVVPLDSTKFSERAIARAKELARLHDAEIVLLHVYQKKGSDYTNQWALAGQQQIADQQYDQVHERMVAIRNQLRLEGVRARDLIIRGGNPAQAICDYVEKEEDICIIVMSSKGLTGLSRLLIGSVAQNVIKQTRVPVVMVTPD